MNERCEHMATDRIAGCKKEYRDQAHKFIE
jgi:hypothetical protein